MDITEIRLGNFRELQKKFRQKEDAEGIPERGELGRLADFTGITRQYLSHVNNERKQIGHATARKLEGAFKLPHGWLDVDHLAGFVHMDARAKEFGSLAMRLYMKDPEGVRALLMKYMEQQMFAEKSAATKRSR